MINDVSFAIFYAVTLYTLLHTNWHRMKGWHVFIPLQFASMITPLENIISVHMTRLKDDMIIRYNQRIISLCNKNPWPCEFLYSRRKKISIVM